MALRHPPQKLRLSRDALGQIREFVHDPVAGLNPHFQIILPRLDRRPGHAKP